MGESPSVFVPLTQKLSQSSFGKMAFHLRCLLYSLLSSKSSSVHVRMRTANGISWIRYVFSVGLSFYSTQSRFIRTEWHCVSCAQIKRRWIDSKEPNKMSSVSANSQMNSREYFSVQVFAMQSIRFVSFCFQMFPFVHSCVRDVIFIIRSHCL